MKKTYQRGDTINALALDKLVEIFRELDWNIEEDRFDCFCKLLSRLKEDEQQLILELTRDFLYCGLNHYPAAISDVVSKVTSIIPKNIKEVVAIPLISPKDIGKVKSGSFLIYLLSPELKKAVEVNGCKFLSRDRCSELANSKEPRRNTLILFVDDFLGSGGTAKEALDEYNEKYRVESDAVLVAVLVAQQTAVNFLREIGVESVYAHLRVRGISDSDRFHDKDLALKLIDQIEDRLKVWPAFRRGFQQTEAMASMIKCPNNTFPVFWLKNKVEGKPWPAPFSKK